MSFWKTGAVVAAFSLLGFSCSSEDLGDAEAITVAVDAENPQWSAGIQELLEKKCDNCHAKSPSAFVPGNVLDNRPRFLWSLAESEAAFAPLALASFGRVSERPEEPMPPNFGTPLSANEKLALENFIKAGALADVCVSYPENTLTWAGSVSAVYSANCASCHASSSGVGGLDLSTAAKWKEHRVSIVNTLVTDRSWLIMPPGKAENFTDAGQPGAEMLAYLCSSSEATSP